MNGEKIDDLINHLKEAQARINLVMDVLEGAKRPHRVKLSIYQAERIRTLRKAGMSLKALAKQFNVGVSCIKNVVYEVNWRKPEVEEAAMEELS